MGYIEIFDDVVSIVHCDYSGCIDKKGWDNAEPFRQQILTLEEQNKLKPQLFQEIVEDYLLDFKDGHMFFRLNGSTQKIMDNGFKCRRYQDKLYITQVGKETRLQRGMAITALDSIPIPELVAKHKRELKLKGTAAERESWEPVILKYGNCNVINKDGQAFEMALKKYEAEPYIPEYSLKNLDNGIPLMTLSDFNNTDEINKLLLDNEALLQHCKHLIIDVRRNKGGSDDAFMKLLEYIFSRETDLNEFDDGTTMQIFMSERNYKLRMDSCKGYLQATTDSDAIHFMNVFIRELEKYKDTVGLVEFNLTDAMPDNIIHGQRNPENIVVLSDVYCGSSGDAFVETAALSDKVTLMGRGTAGITDYSNLAIQNYDNTYQFIYPTSRSGRIDKGKGLTGKGVQPDIYIPWTPEHTEKDVDLEKAVEYLLSK